MVKQEDKSLHDEVKSRNREWVNEYNPFNSSKFFSQYYRWKEIQRGEKIPAPTLISIDPLNLCNEKCVFCNSEFVMDENKGSKLEKDTMNAIPNFLASWNDGRFRTLATCVGGGGEAWMNPYTWEMVEGLIEKGIGVGTVTNGTTFEKWRNLEALSKSTFVGVSINAGTRETYEKVHLRDEFDHVIENVKELLSYSKFNKTKLDQPGRGPGVSWKFLLHPYNVHEVLTATKLAKEYGFKSIHIRPGGVNWFNSEEEAKIHRFTSEHLELFSHQIEEALKYHDDTFGVYGTTHKFNPDFTPANDFEKCYAIFMNGIIMPPSGRNKNQGKYDWGECCDRRGDDLLTGIKDGIDLNQIKEFWGSPAHWKMYDEIRVKQCPKCTYAIHNKIYQETILKDSMTYDFI